MITKLVLKNFKKHEDAEFTFSNGLVALKGANEIGKSSLYHAILYAWFGSRALPLSLAETVTYDKPETSLKVELHFVFEGKDYVIVRSKSGAKLTCGEVTANGQAEVTKFVENLFGVNADSAAKLIIASQNKLRGALENNEAVPLIEKLANINLIDELIGKIQDQLPSGNTSQIVNSISALDDVAEPRLDMDELQPPIDFCWSIETQANLAVLKASEALEDIDVEGAKAIIEEAKRIRTVRKELSTRLATLRSREFTPEVPPYVDVEDLRKKQAAKVLHTTQLEAWRLYQKLIQSSEDRKDLVEGIDQWLVDKKTLEEQVSELRAKRAGVVALKINEQVCGLCGKDLQDVPEVVARNIATTAQVAEIDERSKATKAAIGMLEELIAKHNTYKVMDTNIRSFYARHHSYTEMDSSVFPVRLTWTGDIDPTQVDDSDYIGQIRQAEAATANYIKQSAVASEISKEIVKVTKALTDGEVDEASENLAKAVVEEYDAAKVVLSVALQDYQVAKDATSKAKHTKELAVKQYETELAFYNKSLETKESFKAMLAEYEVNNALIKKLREARPIIATKLWSIVLGSISSHFTQVRGTPSIVTRDASSFLVNGKPAGGLSGSTLDSLGLAIRMALGKTFLPSLNLLLLDEPAAGMDEDRETAMLGLLATTSYEQVVVVTHSELADSFATSVVQL